MIFRGAEESAPHSCLLPSLPHAGFSPLWIGTTRSAGFFFWRRHPKGKSHRAMAARLNPRHSAMVREKIRASQLINRLSDHAFGEVEMTASQIKAAEILLKKSVPDLQSIDLSGTLEHKHSLADVLGSLNKRTGDDPKVA